MDRLDLIFKLVDRQLESMNYQNLVDYFVDNQRAYFSKNFTLEQLKKLAQDYQISCIE